MRENCTHSDKQIATNLTCNMNYSVAILVTSIVFAALVAYFTYKKEVNDKLDQRKQDSTNQAALQSARDSIITQQLKSKDEAAKFHQTSANMANALAQKQNALIEKQQRLVTLQQQNLELAAKLQQGQNRTIEQLTGGESCCRLDIHSINNDNSLAKLSFSLLGDAPLKDVRVRIVNVNKPISNGVSLSEVAGNTLTLGDFNPGLVSLTDIDLPLDTSTGIALNVFFTANNGQSIELFRMAFNKGKWRRAYRILRGEPRKIILEFIDPDFPIVDPEQVFHGH